MAERTHGAGQVVEWQEIITAIPYPDTDKEEVELLESVVGYFEDNGVPQPNRVINAIWLDRVVRNDEHIPHPFPKQRSGHWAGCYLFIDLRGSSGDVLSLYAGMASNLAVRLCQHWNPTNPNIHSGMPPEYWDQLENGKYDDDGKERPDGCPLVAIWFIPDKRDRRRFEHRLLGAMKPIFNVR